MEQDYSHASAGHDEYREVEARRATLHTIYTTLPAYGSYAFWSRIEETDTSRALPLEVLVKCTRFAAACGDDEGRNRIVSMIVRRTHRANEIWAKKVLQPIVLQEDEHNALIADLYADLYERLMRALIDPARLFWE
ncbi:MAG: hypothetical protein M3Z24_15095 [Chloroflexota bacterium]|nr:hypothetical protein [Chloroflexota bacterium]